MKHLKINLITGASALLLSSGHVAQAQSNAEFAQLQKKVATLEQRLSNYESQAPLSPDSKLKLSESVNELKFYGDLRLRYQYDNIQDQVPKADSTNPNNGNRNDTQRSRYRYRLRLNGDFKLAGGFFGGVRLQTSENSDSADQTYENGFSNNNIFISRAYAGWQNESFTLVAGKLPNPFYTTDLIWDGDINPTGLTQSVRLHKLFGDDEEQSVVQDGKTIVTRKASHSPWELTLNLGEFIYDDNAESAFDNDASTDAYLIQAQLVGTWHFTKKFSATLAPGAQFFNAADLSGFSNAAGFSDVTGISGESRDQTILLAPGDVSFKLGSIPAKFYWDFAYNTQGKQRSEDIYRLLATNDRGASISTHKSIDDIAWLAGFEIGKNKKAGDWSVNVNYRQTGIASVDPNLNDSTFGLSFVNTRGPQIGLTYNLTDFLTVSSIYSYAWNLRNIDGGQATGGAFIPPGNVIRVLQVDLSLKF